MELKRKQIIQTIEEEKVIAILRGGQGRDALKLAEALYEGGVRLMELTFDQRDAAARVRTAEDISALRRQLGEKMLFGAGTVTSEEMVRQAREAGAGFIISPDTNPDVIRLTRELGMVSIPGAFSATEVMTAHRAGADFIKLFPADLGGPAYIKALTAPLSQVKLLAVGGVKIENIADYLKAGAVGAGVASCLFTQTLIRDGKWDVITENARRLMRALGKEPSCS